MRTLRLLLVTLLLGAYVSCNINDNQKIRVEIVNGLDGEVGFLSGLFIGENALKGNYNKKELYAIKYALSDKVLKRGELSEKLMKKLRNSKDLDKIINYGFIVK
ncbi:MAG: hypothetical protein IJA09_04930 [Bacteroidales bacterium]|nr:hypothetical protein [Bacteroidales bacterium]